MSNNVLETLKQALLALQRLLPRLFRPTPPVAYPNSAQNAPETHQMMVLRVCKEVGLSKQQTSDLYRTLACESGFNNELVHPNRVKRYIGPRSENGTPLDPVNPLNYKTEIETTDYYLCQVNDWFHIGPTKDFPSVEYVHQNPEKVVRWMANLTKSGQLRLWVCYDEGLYKNYPEPAL